MVVARPIWWVLAVVALVLGVVGIVVPGLPTTPFVILAAWAASRGSPRLHGWLRAHRLFGATIAAWEDGGCIPRRAKVASSVAMGVCAAVLFVAVRPLWAPVGGTVAMLAVARWIWTRPERGPDAPPAERATSGR